VTPEEALLRVLAVTGLSFPRGVLGPETWALARALSDEGDPAADPADLAGAAAAAHWPELRGPMEAALERARTAAAPEDREAFDIVLPWAADPSPDTPLARALAVRAATELAAAGARARERLRAAEAAIAEGGPGAAVAAATAAGMIAADMLDLDPEDFEPEITAYVEAGRRPEDISELARSTGDPEIRTWARSAVAASDDPEAPAASEGVRHLAAGAPPADPAEDLVWVPTILALADEAIERALVDEAEDASAGDASAEDA
jgi:plasmid stability protein